MTELNIASNKFSGTISSNLSQAKFGVFDISNNRFSGFLDHKIMRVSKSLSNSTKFLAYVNRISGFLQSDSINMYDTVSVLDGNKISCSTLPGNDELTTKYKRSYDCETRNLLVSISLWCSVFGLIVAIAWYLWFKGFLEFPKCADFFSVSSKDFPL